MTTALEFFKSKRPSECLRTELQDSSVPEQPGYIYLDRYWVAEESWFDRAGGPFSWWWTAFADRVPGCTSLAQVEAVLWKSYVEGEEC